MTPTNHGPGRAGSGGHQPAVDPLWTGRIVRLRGIAPEDWRSFMNFDENNVRALDPLHHPPRSAEGYRHWAAHRSRQSAPTDEFQLAVETRVAGVLVGSVSTSQADPRAGRFGYGIGIAQEHQRNGYAADAIRVLLKFMFGHRRYHKCEVGIYGFNQASLTLHHKLGFQQEGVLREHEFFAGRHHDLVLMGITAPEFARQQW